MIVFDEASSMKDALTKEVLDLRLPKNFLSLPLCVPMCKLIFGEVSDPMIEAFLLKLVFFLRIIGLGLVIEPGLN